MKSDFKYRIAISLPSITSSPCLKTLDVGATNAVRTERRSVTTVMAITNLLSVERQVGPPVEGK
jgi:hypothetical protein